VRSKHFSGSESSIDLSVGDDEFRITRRGLFQSAEKCRKVFCTGRNYREAWWLEKRYLLHVSILAVNDEVNRFGQLLCDVRNDAAAKQFGHGAAL
jgi:hypothetical protein